METTLLSAFHFFVERWREASRRFDETPHSKHVRDRGNQNSARICVERTTRIVLLEKVLELQLYVNYHLNSISPWLSVSEARTQTLRAKTEIIASLRLVTTPTYPLVRFSQPYSD